jgi:hypothetical protein
LDAHLYLGLLAYWVVNTIRFQLKRKKNASPTAEPKSAGKPQTDNLDSPAEQTKMEYLIYQGNMT